MNIDQFEIVVVNDGSPDASLERILSLKQTHPDIRVVNLSRNFGHHYALYAGIEHARGAHVFIIDCDLEVGPEVLKTFYHEMTSGGYGIVYGYQEIRKGGFVEKRLGGIFWKLFNSLSDVAVHPNILTEALMTRGFVNELLKLGDRNLFMAGMLHWTGFRNKALPVKKGQRQGRPAYTITKRVNLLVDALSSFSSYPLKLLFTVGMVLTLFSFLSGLFFVVRKVLYPDKILTGFTSLIVVILFSTGLIMVSLGVIGIYLAKVFNQVKDRPRYIVERVYD
jgi:putative glycosyltransferase